MFIVAQLLQIAAIAVVNIERKPSGLTISYIVAVLHLNVFSPTLLPLLSTIIATGLSGLSRQAIYHLV
jgi:hypothetical protein